MKKRNLKGKAIFSAVIIFIFAFNIIKNLYPTHYSEYVMEYSEKYEVDSDLVFSIIREESKFFPYARSRKNARGLMQISEITEEWAAREIGLLDVDIFDPKTNIEIGCWYVSKLSDEFGDDQLVIASYNCGSGNVTRWLKNDDYSSDGKSLDKIPFLETRLYVKKVNRSHSIYKKINGLKRFLGWEKE